MKFEFDSNNATELRAVEAAVAVLVSAAQSKPNPIHEIAKMIRGDAPQTSSAQPEAAAHHVTEANRLTVEQVASVFDVPVEVLKDLPGAVVSDDGQTVTGSGEVETIRVDTLEPIPAAEELDSTGQPWNAELHSSSRAKVADGTWKKKRSVKPVAEEPREHVPATPEQAEEIKADMAAAFSAPTPPTPPVPPAPAVPEFHKRVLADDDTVEGSKSVPLPPAPQADGLVTMNDIWALITNGKTTINVVLAAAQRMGFADLGKVAQTATAEQRAALLKELTA